MYNNTWDSLNWEQIEYSVYQVQKQIYDASRAGNVAATRNLQTFLSQMAEPRFLAVKVVTTNKGKNTPGIDGWIALNDEDKFFLANSLALDGTTDLVRRIYIPKPRSEDRRPIGIPTIRDRAKQALCKFILEPEYEAKAESNSFGFRPGRSAIDAVSKIRAHLIFKGPCYVLDTDIRKCFDRINHNYLRQKLNAIPAVDLQIDAWLRAGIFDKSEIIFPAEGTPQGSIISPLLANIALDGLQNFLAQGITQKYGKSISYDTYFVRYADDFVILAPNFEAINYAKELSEIWLKYIGLEMKEEATRTIYTLRKISDKTESTHFDFLGFRFKQRFLSKHQIHKEGGKITNVRTFVLINPRRIERHKASISSLIKKIGKVKELIEELNPRITGWSNYFSNSNAKEYGDLPRKMDIWMNTKIRKWIRRTAKLRGKPDKYWKKETKDWVLYYQDKEGKEITLKKYSSFRWSIYDYKAINSYYSPYQLDYKEYKKLN